MKRLLTLSSLFLVMTMTLSCGSDVVNDTTNPLLEEWTTEFGIPPFDKIRTEHYAPAFEEAMKMHNEEIAAIVESEEEPTFENVILAMDNAGVKLYELNLIFGMLSSSDLDDKMQEVQNTMMPRVEEHYNSIMLNDKLFERVKAVYDKRKSLKLVVGLLHKTHLQLIEFEAITLVVDSLDTLEKLIIEHNTVVMLLDTRHHCILNLLHLVVKIR